MKTPKIKDNFFDYLPRPNALFPAAPNAAGHIELADFGSFVWRAMDDRAASSRVAFLSIRLMLCSFISSHLISRREAMAGACMSRRWPPKFSVRAVAMVLPRGSLATAWHRRFARGRI
jgi:hypothetical protein